MKIRKLIIPVVGVLIVLIGYLGTRPISDPRPHGPVTWEFVHASQIRMALFDYSNNHNGVFPKQLSELPPNSIPPEARQFHDPETKQVLDWIYYPGYHREDKPNTIILVAPHAVQKNQRIAVLSDCSARILNEDEFVNRISEQLNRK